MPDTNISDVFIGRQPILDRQQNLVAYELLFRAGTQNAASVNDDLLATASVINYAFSELGVEQALGDCLGFINCDAAMLLSDIPELLPADKIVLEILETVEVNPTLVARCAELKSRGFTLALDDFIDDHEKWAPLLDLVDIVKVDLMPLDEAALIASTQALKRWPVRLLAEKVDSEAQADLCRQLGYDLFQGYFFAKPAILSGKKLGQSQLALMQLMSLILGDAETTELEAAFKQHPGLAVNILRLTNSVATGARMKVISLRHAITVLGRRQLQRWLQLVLYTNPSSNSVSNPLMQLAATRGRLLELLAIEQKVGTDYSDKAFLTGIMSLMPALMKATMEDILHGVQLSPEVSEALLYQKGPLGELLQLATTLESDDSACVAKHASICDLEAEQINRCQASAMTWAGEIAREAQ